MKWDCVNGVWVRWIDNRLVLNKECACCGETQAVITDKKIYYSLFEKTVLYYVRLAFLDVQGNYMADWLGRCELDMFIPSIRAGIEIDSSKYHKSTGQEHYKDMLCAANGVKLVRIRDRKCTSLNDSSIEIPYCYNSIPSKEKAIRECLLQLGTRVDVNLKRDKDYITEWHNRHLLKELKHSNPEMFDMFLCEECQELCFGKAV